MRVSQEHLFLPLQLVLGAAAGAMVPVAAAGAIRTGFHGWGRRELADWIEVGDIHKVNPALPAAVPAPTPHPPLRTGLVYEELATEAGVQSARVG